MVDCDKVLQEVRKERQRQDSIWGIQDHDPEGWLPILGEEFGEVCKEIYEAGMEKSTEWNNYRTELIQLAAVAVAMVESFDRATKGGSS